MRKHIKGIRQSNIILLVIVIFVSYIFIAIMGHYFKDSPEQKYFTPKDFITELPPNYWYKVVREIEHRYYEMPWLNEYYEMQSLMWNISMSYDYIATEYIGRYFITAYCPEECGYNGNNYPIGWKTSTDVICHYSDDWREPTTCAIDPKVRKYGEYIMVGNPDSSNKKIYHCEDCGPGVQGCWVDCFVETMDEVRSWNTRYDNVYLVKFKTASIDGNLYRIQKNRSDIIRETLMPKELEYYEFGG